MNTIHRTTSAWLGLTISVALMIFAPSGYLADRTSSISRSTPAAKPVSPATPETLKKQVNESYGKLPLIFEANEGQVDEPVKFVSRGSGYNLYLTANEAVLALKKRSGQATTLKDQLTNTVRLKLVGENQNARVTGIEQQATKVNYFIGNDPEKWRPDIPTYAKIKYGDVYPGVDLFYYGNQRQLEYDFVVAPGANPDLIRLAFDGVQRIRIDARGDLILQVAGGKIRQKKPVIYQEAAGFRQYVEGHYVLKGKRQVGFKIAKYDRQKPLTIDPVLIYSTYLGGSRAEAGNGIAVDANGNAYVTGFTNSIDFPTASPFQSVFRGTNDVFVTKLNATGTAAIYSTYLGGSGNDHGEDIAVDSAGNAYVTGFTTGNFPTMNPVQANIGGGFDAFVTKLNPAGSALVYSTYLGGSGNEQDFGANEDLAVDQEGNVYVTGRTNSTNFPTVNPLQPAYGGGRFDCFITKIHNTGSAFVYSTYLGGSGDDRGYGIAVNATGNAYVTGVTFSTNFPVANPLDSSLAGPFDAFVAKLNVTGTALVYSTYLGGNDQEDGFGGDIAVDALGNAYVTGSTGSTDFPTVNPIQATRGGTGSHDLFVTKLNPTGTALIYSTYLGRSGTDAGTGIAVDIAGNVYVTGFTSGVDFPTINSLDNTRGGSTDAIVAKLNSTGSAVFFSTYFGGSAEEMGHAIAVDTAGNAYITGQTTSIDLSTASSLQPSLRGTQDAFVAKIFDSSIFPLQAIVPNRGGNNGDVSVAVLGAGFQPGATVKLTAPNQPDIEGANPVINNSSINTTFDLRGAVPGLRDVVVTLPDNSTAKLPNGFLIEQGGFTQVWIDIVGRDTIRAGRGQTYNILYGNRGNIDVNEEQIVVISWPVNGDLFIEGAISAYGQPLPAPSIEGAEKFLGIFVPRVRAGGVQSIPIRLVVSGESQNPVMSAAIISLPKSISSGDSNSLTAPTVTGMNLMQTEADSEDTPPIGATVFVGPHGANPFGHEAIAGRRSDGTVGIWDSWMTQEDPETIELFGQPVPFEVWKAKAEGRYLGWGVPPGFTDAIGEEVVDKTSRLILEGRAPWVMDFGAKSDAGFTCSSFVEHVYELAGLDPIHPILIGPASLPLDPLLLFPSLHYRYFTGRGNFYLSAEELYPADQNPKLWAVFTLAAWSDLYNSHLLAGFRAAQLLRFKFFRIVQAYDPNDKVGSGGEGSARYLSGDEPLRYSVFFENVETATAPAQEVIITDQLDTSHIDLTTFSFGRISFGNKHAIPPSALSEFTTNVDLRPENDLIVNIDARLNKQTGLVTWKFTSIDPATGLPAEDPLAGFLPPNTNPPAGEGSVSFTVMPKQGLLTGAEVRNQASIVFDANPPIQTATWSNTIDNSTPISQVHTLTPAPCSSNLNVQWSGTDTGSGTRDYTVYVSDNGGPFTVWQHNTTATSGVYAGQFGHTYAFHSVARDHTGNTETAPDLPDATVSLQTPAPPVFTDVPPSLTVYTGTEATACGAFVTDTALGTAVAQSSCPVNVTRHGIPSGNFFPVGNTTITYTAKDVLGNTASATQTVTVVDNTAPDLMVPAPLPTPATLSCQVAIPDVVSASAASDSCEGPVTLTQSPTAGTLVTPGRHIITVTAVDAAGNSKSVTTTFTVSDAPVFQISVNPTTVRRGNNVRLNATFANCAAGPQTVTLKLSLTTPRSSTLVSAFPVTLQAGQNGSFSIPITIPKSTPAGLYTLTLDVYVAGIRTSTTTTQLMVTL